MGSKAEKKVIIVGKYCVGKTALIHRFTTNRFNELSSYEPVSIVSIASKDQLSTRQCNGSRVAKSFEASFSFSAGRKDIV